MREEPKQSVPSHDLRMSCAAACNLCARSITAYRHKKKKTTRAKSSTAYELSSRLKAGRTDQRLCWAAWPSEHAVVRHQSGLSATACGILLCLLWAGTHCQLAWMLPVSSTTLHCSTRQRKANTMPLGVSQEKLMLNPSFPFALGAAGLNTVRVQGMKRHNEPK